MHDEEHTSTNTDKAQRNCTGSKSPLIRNPAHILYLPEVKPSTCDQQINTEMQDTKLTRG